MYIKLIYFFLTLHLFFSRPVHSVIGEEKKEDRPNLAKANIERGQNEKETEFLDFKAIKSVLKNDQLASAINKKVAQKKNHKFRKKRKQINRYNIPSEKRFWTFFSELWLVRNAEILKWDFKKPDYGLQESFRFFLERLGHYEVRFKILLVNSSNIGHFSLPSDKGEIILLLSVPFIRTLDLSKLEISLLMYEDFQRNKLGFFKKQVKDKKLGKILGSNFYKNKKVQSDIFDPYLKKYDEIIYDKGFTTQQQFDLTKHMKKFLASDPKLKKVYINMIKKIDNLVKSNLLYRKYIKIYPSPELQINWLTSKTKQR